MERKIILQSDRAGNGDIYVTNAGGSTCKGSQIMLPEKAILRGNPMVKKILFNSNRDGNDGIVNRTPDGWSEIKFRQMN